MLFWAIWDTWSDTSPTTVLYKLLARMRRISMLEYGKFHPFSTNEVGLRQEARDEGLGFLELGGWAAPKQP